MACAFEPTDASFNAIAKAQGGFEPFLLFVTLASFGFGAGLWQGHLFDAHLARDAFIFRRIHAAIRCCDLGRMAKQFLVVFQTSAPLLVIARIALQNPILTNNPAVHFTIPQFASELGFVWGALASLNNGRMGLEQTDNFLRRGHLLFCKHALGGLVKHLPHQRQIVFEGRD